MGDEGGGLDGREGQQPGPEVSVVIPCHNSTATIGLQLRALSRQRDAPGFEVLLVDNLSTDDLAAAAAAWTDALDITVVQATVMPNPGYARNVGVRHARADILAFCDSDDYVSADWVRAAADAMQSTALANGGATPTDESRFELGADHLDAMLTPHPAEGLQIPEEPPDYPILLGGSCVMRREVYLAVGGYDVTVPYGVEDNDLALRLQEAGFLIARAQAMGLAYRIRPHDEEPPSRDFLNGYRHMLLAHRHDLFGRSPSLPPRWYLGTLRCAAAGARMLLRPGTRDWRSLARRTALQAGLLAGHLRYGLFGRPPAPRPGVGLTP